MSEYVDQLLGEIEISPKSTPAELRARADEVMGDFYEAVVRPARLSAEAALLRARADAIESAAEKRAALEAAEGAARAAEDRRFRGDRAGRGGGGAARDRSAASFRAGARRLGAGRRGES